MWVLGTCMKKRYECLGMEQNGFEMSQNENMGMEWSGMDY